MEFARLLLRAVKIIPFDEIEQIMKKEIEQRFNLFSSGHITIATINPLSLHGNSGNDVYGVKQT